MEAVQTTGEGPDLEKGPHFAEEAESEQRQAWEEIDVGRYMPRRIRGSCRGRALG